MSSLIYNLDVSSISEENHDAGVRAHRAILRAITDRDVERTGRYMRAHIQGFADACRHAGFDPAEKTVPDVIRLAGQVHRLGGAGLHAVRHFEGIDARGDLGVAYGGEALAVERVDSIQRLALERVVDARGVRQVQHGVAAGAQ